MRPTRRPPRATPAPGTLVRGALLAGVTALAAPAGLRAQGEEPPPVRPTRPTIANDAEVHRPGVLQTELGYSAYGRSPDARDQEAASLLVRYAFTERFLAHASFEPVESERDLSGRRATGVGDVHLLGQGVLVTGAERHPAVAVAYDAKLPTASTAEGLGTGRVDHRVVLLVSRDLSGTSLVFNAAYLNNGRDTGGRVGGAQWAFAVGREPEGRGWGSQWEVATETLDAGDPRGTYALGAATYHTSDRVRLDAGVRAGLTRESPHAELFLGVTAGAPLARRVR